MDQAKTNQCLNILLLDEPGIQFQKTNTGIPIRNESPGNDCRPFRRRHIRVPGEGVPHAQTRPRKSHEHIRGVDLTVERSGRRATESFGSLHVRITIQICTNLYKFVQI